ncbi:MAG: YceD family protein [Candidatus Brocadiia bacterium]
MKVAVSSLEEHPVQLDAQESPGELELSAEGVEFAAPVDVSVKLTRMQENVLAEGVARTTVRLSCSRCLEPVDLGLEGKFEALFVPDTGAYAERMGRRDFEWADQRVEFYSERTIDLTNEINQALRLELPMKPLCQPHCAGLCPECGKNLNRGPCGCQPEQEDDVWAPLREIVSDDESDDTSPKE